MQLKPTLIRAPKDRSKVSHTAVYLFAVLIIELGLYVLPLIFPHNIGSSYMGLYGLMLGLSLYMWRYQPLPPKHVLMIGIIAILVLSPLSALTSNDAERYLWDGRVFLSGLDPYVTSPNNPAVADLRAIWPTPEEHSDYATLYPPGALTLFALSATAGPTYGIWLWKFIAISAALLNLTLGYDLLRRRNLLSALPLIALSPLLLFETGAGLHVDIICVLAVTAALWCLETKRIIQAGIILGIAATVKFLPAVIIGPLLFFMKPKHALQIFLAASLTWLSVYGLMFAVGYKPLGLLPTFFEKWRGGAPIYPLLEGIKTTASLSTQSFLGLLGLIAAILFGLSAYLARRGYIIIAISLSIATPLLLSPVLFPWYLMILIPLFALRPTYTVIAAITVVPLSYEVLNQWLSAGHWSPAVWPSYILLAGIITGLCLDLFKARAKIS